MNNTKETETYLDQFWSPDQATCIDNLLRECVNLKAELTKTKEANAKAEKELTKANRIIEITQRAIDNRPLCPDCRDKTKATDECLRCKSQRLDKANAELVKDRELLNRMQADYKWVKRLHYSVHGDLIGWFVIGSNNSESTADLRQAIDAATTKGKV